MEREGEREDGEDREDREEREERERGREGGRERGSLLLSATNVGATRILI